MQLANIKRRICLTVTISITTVEKFVYVIHTPYRVNLHCFMTFSTSLVPFAEKNMDETVPVCLYEDVITKSFSTTVAGCMTNILFCSKIE